MTFPSKQDFTNREVQAETLRYCPNCDPEINNPIRTAPQQCSCGATLVVVTPWSPARKGQVYG
jgi:hypothetical protein